MVTLEVLNELCEWSDLFDGHSDPIDHLAASLFVNSPNPRARLMAFFNCYLDASGNADQENSFVVVSGYIANFLQWRAFENLWKQIHAEHGVNTPFHMAEFMAATANPDRYEKQRNARADYVAIGRDFPRATEFFKNICIAEQTMVNCGISCIVDMRIYNSVSSLLDLRKVVPPYALAARACLVRIHDWEDTFAVREPVECIFEKGDLEQDKFTALLRGEGGSDPIYKPKKDFAGLQAADHYAWEQFYHLKKERTGETDAVRDSFVFALNYTPCMHLEVTQEGLITLCHKKGISPRTGVQHDEK